MKRLIAIGLGCLFVVGCTVGPHYEAPQIHTSERFLSAPSAGETPPALQGSVPESAWWGLFDDPSMMGIIEQAITSNYDLEIARARVRETRALRAVAAGKLLPDVGASGSAQHSRASEEGLGLAQIAESGLADLENDLFQVGFDASWEIDLFGGKRRAVESARARLEAVIEARRDVLLSVIAEVARNYVELRGVQQRLQVAEKNIRTQSQTLELIENKHRVGLAPELDVARARALLESSRARLPQFRTTIRATAHRLGVLVGQPPETLIEDLLPPRALPAAPDAVPVGLPSALLLRRPDLRRAERTLHAATAEIGVAKADLFPKFVLTAGRGHESTSPASLADTASSFWFLGSLIRWPILQGGRIRANIRAVEARHEVALAQYRQAVLVALEDVESALIRFTETQAQRASVAASAKASARALELAQVLYKTGLTDHLNVLDAERTLLEVEDHLATTETALVAHLIGLYKALGGGWEQVEAAAQRRTVAVAAPRSTSASARMDE